MNVAVVFTRLFFILLSSFLMGVYSASLPEGSVISNTFLGAGIGFLFGLFLIICDVFFKRFNLRSFNIAIIGIFFGYLMGLALNLVFGAVLEISQTIHIHPQVQEMIKISLFLFGIFIGTNMTLRTSDELYVSIPFVKFTPTSQKKKDVIIDFSLLSDARVVDLASTGFIDKQIIVPRFVVKELYTQIEIGDENQKIKAKRALEVLKKLESMHELELKYNDTDFPEVKDHTNKIIRLARLLDCNILTADISKIQTAVIEGVRIINIHTLSNSLKPLMQTGETIKIKIQRYGKEPRQGVGYLDDGTMVVVNGGGEFIGQTIDSQVLSVKHTSSGRMIFCNARDEPHPENFGIEYEDAEQ